MGLILPASQPLDFEGAHRRFRELLLGPPKRVCQHCATHAGLDATYQCRDQDIQLEPSRTAYPWDGQGEDPNRPIPLCRPCAEEHHKHWDAMGGQAPL